MKETKDITTIATVRTNSKVTSSYLSRRSLLKLLGVSALSMGSFVIAGNKTQAASVSANNLNIGSSQAATGLTVATCLSPDGSVALNVTHSEKGYTLAVVDAATKKQLTNIALSNAPCVVSYTRAGKQMNFTLLNAQSGGFTGKNSSLLDAKVVRPQLIPQLEFGLIFSQISGELAVIKTNSIKRQANKAAVWTALSIDGRTAYVSKANSLDVSVVDCDNTNSLVRVLSAV